MTVLLSTKRKGIESELKTLSNFGSECGMKVNNVETKYFVVNGEPGDRKPLCVTGLVVEYCTSYGYLGSHFTYTGSVSASDKQHTTWKISHVLKSVSFVEGNRRSNCSKALSLCRRLDVITIVWR